MDPKPWYQSKTIWLNVVTVLIVSLTAISREMGLTATQLEIIAVIVAVLNILLRVLTDRPLAG
jgi:hypothetical protein